MCIAVVVGDFDDDQVVDMVEIFSQPFFGDVCMYPSYYQIPRSPYRDLVGYMTGE